MDFIIDGEKIDSEDYSGASIYLDACFILTYLDKSDKRRPDVARVLDTWAEYPDVTLGISNHTVAEVINRIFQMLILGSLQIFHENNRLINQTKDGYEKLTPFQKEQLVNLDSARYLYSLAKKEEILRLYKKEVNVNISELIKMAKEHEIKRKKLDTFYNIAITKFESFINCMRSDLDFTVEFLDSMAEPDYQVAKTNMRFLQLDITDSFHLAIAKSNDYDFLATLDSDFIHNLYSTLPELSMKIIKVA
jgi:predicted nucleic acid-binding protein